MAVRLIDADKLMTAITEHGHNAVEELEDECKAFRVVDIVIDVMRIVKAMPVYCSRCGAKMEGMD